MQAPAYILTVVTGSGYNTETVLASANARLVKIVPIGTPTGTLVVRESSTAVGAAAKFTLPISSTGIDFGTNGVAFSGGLTVQSSVAGDVWNVVWGARL